MSNAKHFASWDGVDIAYEQWGNADAATPPVVLHHGFGVSGKLNWVSPGVVRALTEAGRSVIAIDARGHGRSGKPHDVASYGEATMARDLIMLFDQLGAPRFDLVGYSMGSVVSLLAAVKEPRIERLVIGGVGCGVVELGGLDTRALPSGAIREALLADDASGITEPAAAQFRFLADVTKADRFALAAQAGAVHASPIALDRIRAATLVIAGADDPLASRPEVLANAIIGATLQVVAGDHMTAVSNPELAAALVAFLARG